MNLSTWTFSGVSDRRAPGVQGTSIHSRPRRGRGGALARPTRLVAAVSALLLPVALGLPVVAATAAVAPVGQGFTVTPSDLAFILKQIKIAEQHAATASPANPCQTMVGTGPNQIPSPLVSRGLRTVDGSCNNLQPGQETFGAADQVFPRLGSKQFKPAEPITASFPVGPVGPTSYAQKRGSVVDSQPRMISNLIVDQTSTNPAAIAAAGSPVRTQNATGVLPCTIDPDPLAVPEVVRVPLGCTPSFQTLFMPNVTTDVGLSPPYNSLFTLFGQFFDHGVDQTVKGGSGTVFVPLQADDPLIPGPDHRLGTGDDLNVNLRFMVLTRAQNQPGPDGVLGDVAPTTAGVGPCTARNVPAGCDESIDDVQDAKNTDSPWVDQSQTYTSHPSHQVFVREYVNNTGADLIAGNADDRPVSTGKLLGGPAGPTAGGMATWATVKAQAATLLGLLLEDKDVTDVPMMAADPYGKFIPGPARGLPQYVTSTGLVEGCRATDAPPCAGPVPVPANVLHLDTPFLTDIAHNADPGKVGPCTTLIGVTPRLPAGCLSPDADTAASADFANQPVGTYDDEMLNAHFAAGDGRVNENIGLTAIHQVFHSEHDRLVTDIQNTLTNDTSGPGTGALAEWKLAAGANGWNGERIFQAARFVTEMEYQHLVFEEFARKVQPAINPFQPFAFTQTEINPAVKAEFAHAVYRFGHSMLTETISRRNEDLPGVDGIFGTPDDIRGSQNDISLLAGFLNPPAYTDGGPAGPLTSEQAAGSIMMGMSDQVGSELDEFVTETLRNKLLGLPLDLAAINMTRARSEGVPALNVLRRELFASTNDGQLRPYTNWVDFGQNIKHPQSLVNFVAAYGLHPSIIGATTLVGKRAAAKLIVDPAVGDVPPADAAAFMNSTNTPAVPATPTAPAEPAANWANTGTTSITGVDNIDLWVGGLAEVTNLFGGLLGSTFNYVFENQMTQLQNGDRLYYLARTPGMNLRTQLEGNSFAELVMRNTNAKALKADPFATADCKFELKNLAGTPAGFAASGNTVVDDPASECNETALLIRMPDGTIQYRARNTVNPAGINGQSVYNGTANVDRIYGGNDNDTFWGGRGNDVIEGGGGADVALGGEGNDIITDFAGDDVLKGGPGNDAIDGGTGLDIIMGAEGNDFTNGGANANTTFAGAGNDFMILGDGIDGGLGDSGDDWIEGGNQPDGLIGDSSNLFFTDDNAPGDDILIGQGGDDDYDMEGGNDIGVAGPGIEKNVGAAGYDWTIGQGDPQPQDADLSLPIAPLDILTIGVRDKFNEVEALSGGPLNDKLRGDNLVPSAVGGGGFIGCDALDQEGLDKIAGLDALVPPLATPVGPIVAAAVTSDCSLVGPNVWGDGNILLGGGGSDLIEGRGADDIIDGDRYLSVRLSVRTNPADPASEIGSAGVEGPGQSAMTSQYLRDTAGALTGPTLQQAVFAGTVDPGNIVAVREILTPPAAATVVDVDTAVFSDIRANYDCIVEPAVVAVPCGSTSSGVTTKVIHARGLGLGLGLGGGGGGGGGGGIGNNGTDTIRNIERLSFSDSVVPAAPVIGIAVGGNASATVNWTPPTGPVTSFVVEASTGGTVFSTTPVTPGTATSTVVSGLTNNIPFTFRVAAVNAIGAGPQSGASNVVTPTAPAVTVPGAPTIGIATAGIASATVSWTPPASDGGSPITGYTVQVIDPTTGAQVGVLQPAAAGTTSLVVTPLTNETIYRFRVRAVNVIGSSIASGLSNRVTPTAVVVAGTAPGAPIIRNAASGVAGVGLITATANWRIPIITGSSPITGYVVTALPTVGTSITSVVLTPAAGRDQSFVMTLPAGNYRFTVVAINAVGSGVASGQSNLVTAR